MRWIIRPGNNAKSDLAGLKEEHAVLGKPRFRLASAANWTMLGLGAVSLAVSIIYTSPVLAFVGLGLTFWSVVLLYIREQEQQPVYQPQKEQVQERLVESARSIDQSIAEMHKVKGSTSSELLALDQLVKELDCKGAATYLPSRHHRTEEGCRVFISKQEISRLPTLDEIRRNDNRVSMKNPAGLLLTPPGTQLACLIAKKIVESFEYTSVEDLLERLSRVLSHDLKIAKDLQMQMLAREVRMRVAPYVSLVQLRRDTFKVRIVRSVYADMYKQSERIRMYKRIGAPDLSALACALAENLGKPVRIEKIEFTEKTETLECCCRIIEDEQLCYGSVPQ